MLHDAAMNRFIYIKSMALHNECKRMFNIGIIQVQIAVFYTNDNFTFHLSYFVLVLKILWFWKFYISIDFKTLLT